MVDISFVYIIDPIEIIFNYVDFVFLGARLLPVLADLFRRVVQTVSDMLKLVAIRTHDDHENLMMVLWCGHCVTALARWWSRNISKIWIW